MNEQLKLDAEQMGMTVDEYQVYLAEMAEMAQAVHGLTAVVKDLTDTVATHAATTKFQINSAQWHMEGGKR